MYEIIPSKDKSSAEQEKHFSGIREAPWNKKSTFPASGKPPETRKALFRHQGSLLRQEKHFSGVREVS